MSLNIVQKYKLNTEDFKIYFDNNKKTHVAENIETGEKTNIGVLGIFLEMGILRPLDDEDKLVELKRKIEILEKKIELLMEKIENMQFKQVVCEKEVEEKPKFDIKQKIIEKSLSKIKYDENIIKDDENEEKIWEEI
ncbi:MAG: hypothetical protein QXO84_00510 [Candidatus Aenigmatarchaeota archaeon]